jgi:hypothetical protein
MNGLHADDVGEVSSLDDVVGGVWSECRRRSRQCEAAQKRRKVRVRGMVRWHRRDGRHMLSTMQSTARVADQD